MYPVYSMFYTENLGLCDYVLFSQIRSQMMQKRYIKEIASISLNLDACEQTEP